MSPSATVPVWHLPITQSQPVKAMATQNFARVPVAKSTNVQAPPHTSAIPTPPSSSQLYSNPTFAPPTSNVTTPNAPDDCSTPQLPGSAGYSSEALIQSLYEACHLDQLPQDKLERLIADVIREDGFKDLVSP